MENKQEAIIPLVKIGDIFSLGIRRFGKDGDPIVFYKGFAIFLKSTGKKGFNLNEMLKVKVTKVFPKFAFAEVVNG